MGIKVGGIDIANSIINLEFQVGKLSRIVDLIINTNRQEYESFITKEAIQSIEEEVIKQLQQKYPEAGITRSNP